MTVFIRPYRPSDQSQVEWLYSRTPPAGQIAIRPEPAPPDLKDPAAHFEAFWVAIEMQKDEEAVVGMTAIERVGDHERDVPVPDFIDIHSATARIHHVAVAPERWRKGIGRTMVDTAVTWARTNGFAAVIVETTPEQLAAVALYRNVGFTPAGVSMVGRWQVAWFRQNL